MKEKLKETVKSEVEKNLGLVGYVVRKKYCPDHLEKRDLFQEGVLGLIDAVKKFDSSKGIAFSSFAYSCVQFQINNYLRKNKPLEFYEDDPGHDVFDEQFFNSLDLRIAMDTLSPKENQLIRMLYFKEMTLSEVGKKLGVSHTSVARGRDKALSRLKEKVA